MGLKSGGLCFFDSGFCGFHERSEHQKEREMDIPGRNIQALGGQFFQRGKRWGEGGFRAEGKVWYLVD